jgi:hypothetical protein
MFKVVRFFRPFAIAVAPESPTLLPSESFHYLLIYKVVMFLKLFAIAVAPESPILLLSE